MRTLASQVTIASGKTYLSDVWQGPQRYCLEIHVRPVSAVTLTMGVRGAVVSRPGAVATPTPINTSAVLPINSLAADVESSDMPALTARTAEYHAIVNVVDQMAPYKQLEIAVTAGSAVVTVYQHDQ